MKPTERARRLLAVSKFPLYGLDIGRITGLGAARLYPALVKLEREGFVTSFWGSDTDPNSRRRYYRIASDH
jgi:DNA-binding PadR family transcriptional regulator